MIIMKEKYMRDIMTYSDAIEKVMQDNGGFAELKYIYDNIQKYRLKTGKTPDNTIQERVQRDPRFTRIAYGVYALTEFLEEVEKNDIGKFTTKKNKIVFERNTHIETTESILLTKIRIGQQTFRDKLLELLKFCPITKIDDKRLLIASHIKPWAFSDNEERLDVFNGFLFSPLYDKLFDKSIGLITFTPEKKVLISKRLSKQNRDKLGIKNGQIIEDLPVEGREKFLEFHRKHIFQE